jgi:hypothetical protein
MIQSRLISNLAFDGKSNANFATSPEIKKQIKKVNASQ